MSDERWKALHGDCLDVLKALPDESVDAVVTDPPYGLSNHDASDVAEALRAWLDGKPYTPKGGGFMNKAWDAFVPGPEVWKECLRVLKPGGHLLVFSGSRTQDLMGMSVRLAGFDSRDAIRVEGILSWGYFSGFPKSHNVASYAQSLLENGYTRKVLRRGVGNLNGKFAEAAVDFVSQSKSREITHPEAKKWEGWGTALKPSYEPVLMFRKPLIGNVAANVLAHGTGAININGCRIEAGPDHAKNCNRNAVESHWKLNASPRMPVVASPLGRWPPNTVLTHTPDCVKVGTVTVKAPVINRFDDGAKPFGGGAGHAYTSTGGGTEEIDSWECADGCAVKALDGQSGERKSQGRRVASPKIGFGMKAQPEVETGYGDEGGASRFFPQFSYTPDDAPFFYTTKAGRAERDEGLSGAESKQVDESRDPDAPGANNPRNRGGRSAANFHPTVKPIALMRWLAKLVTPPGGTVLDPFCGSGTTGCAAMYEGFNFIGIEQSEEYLEIARQRIEYHALRAQGGVVNPWEAPAPEKAPVTETPDDGVGSLEDLFGFGE